ATDVAVTDLLPAGLRQVVVSPSKGTFENGIWSVGTVAVGETAILQIATEVLQTGNITNTAFISNSSPADPVTTNNRSSVTISGDPQAKSADLVMYKSVNNSAPTTDDTVTFTLIVSNNGPDHASGVTVNDLLPSGLRYVDHNAASGQYDGTTGQWTVGALNKGASATLQIRAKVGSVGPIINIAQIAAANEPDPNRSNNSAIVQLNAEKGPGVADIVVKKVVNNLRPTVGSTVEFTISAKNLGPDPATNVSILETLPPGLTFVSATTSKGYLNGQIWQISALAVDETAELKVVTKVTAPGALKNTAVKIQSDQSDPINANNESDVSVSVANAADIAVNKTADNIRPEVGSNVTFVVTVTNNGPDAATNVEVTDLLPMGLELVVVSPSVGTWGNNKWKIGSLALGQTVQMQMTTRVMMRGSNQNTATVSASDQPDPVPSNNAATVTVNALERPVDLSVSKRVDKSAPSVGQNVTYTIVLRNESLVNATGVQVQDNLPEGLQYLSHRVTHGQFNPDNGIWLVGNHEAAKVDSLFITAKVVSGAAGLRITNRVDIVTMDQTEGNGFNNTAMVSINVTNLPPTDLSISQVVTPQVTQPGGALKLAVTAVNNGPQTAANALLTVQLPPETVYNSTTLLPNGWSLDAPTSGTSGRVRFSVPTFTTGASVSFELALTTLTTVSNGTNFTVVSSVVSDHPETTLANNAVQSVVSVADRYDLSIEAYTNNPIASYGENVELNYTVRNLGPAGANGVQVTNTLPSGLVNPVLISTSQGTYVTSNGAWSIGSVGNGGAVTLRIRATVATNATSYTNIADIVCNVGCADTNPANNRAILVISPQQSSSALYGGVESNGDRAMDLNHAWAQTRLEMLTAPVSAMISAKIEGPVTRFTEASTIGLSGTTPAVKQVLPQIGPSGAQALDQTPSWIIGQTNAQAVYGVDYMLSGRRLAAALVMQSQRALYEHTKAVCDRLGGAVLESVETILVNGRPFVLQKLTAPDGKVDYAISFVAYNTGSGFTVDSRFTLAEYQIPGTASDVLNFQLWSVDKAATAGLVQTTLQTLQAQGNLTFLNDVSSTPATPKVFVRSGRAMGNGTMLLEIQNNGGARNVTIQAETRTTESGTWSATRTWTRQLDTVTTDTVQVSLGSLYFDVRFRMTNDTTTDRDQLYFSDGAWGYNNNSGAATINTFTVTSDSPGRPSVGIFPFERNARVAGTLTGSTWMSLFRYVAPGRRPADLSGGLYQYIEFEARGNQPVEVQLIKSSVTNWDQFRKTVNLTSSLQRYKIPLNQFGRLGGGTLSLNDLELLGFYVRNDQPYAQPFDLEVRRVRLVTESYVPIESEQTLPENLVLEQNYPNPFNPSTNIRFSLPQPGKVTLAVYDVLGRRIAVLLNEVREVGNYEVRFDASNLPNGTYFYSVSAGGKTVTKKMILLK
ncbi:MAG TPA: T9SS type A sorting domain-containing protein, partial [Rhodothermales bacterium]|nr:T9SS type A sorting domain-containing protein [Rhodothermales bacterium]